MTNELRAFKSVFTSFEPDIHNIHVILGKKKSIQNKNIKS